MASRLSSLSLSESDEEHRPLSTAVGTPRAYRAPPAFSEPSTDDDDAEEEYSDADAADMPDDGRGRRLNFDAFESPSQPARLLISRASSHAPSPARSPVTHRVPELIPSWLSPARRPQAPKRMPQSFKHSPMPTNSSLSATYSKPAPDPASSLGAPRSQTYSHAYLVDQSARDSPLRRPDERLLRSLRDEIASLHDERLHAQDQWLARLHRLESSVEALERASQRDKQRPHDTTIDRQRAPSFATPHRAHRLPHHHHHHRQPDVSTVDPTNLESLRRTNDLLLSQLEQQTERLQSTVLSSSFTPYSPMSSY